MFRLTLPLSASVLAAAMSGAAIAQTDSFQPELAEQPEELEFAPTRPNFPLWDFRVGAEGYATTDSDFDAGPGRVRRSVGAATAGATITLSPQFRILIDGRGEYRHYDFSGATNFDPIHGQPFESLYRAHVDVMGQVQATERWQIVAGVRAASQGEVDAHFNDSLTGRLYGGPVFKVNEDLTIGMGIVIQSRLEDSALVAPAPLISYRLPMNRALSFHLNTLEGAELRFDPSERWGVALEADWAYNEFRLDDSGFAPDGVYRETAVRVGLRGDWRPSGRLTLNAGIGAMVWQEIELIDAGGQQLSKDNLLPGGYVSLGLQYRF